MTKKITSELLDTIIRTEIMSLRHDAGNSRKSPKWIDGYHTGLADMGNAILFEIKKICVDDTCPVCDGDGVCHKDAGESWTCTECEGTGKVWSTQLQDATQKSATAPQQSTSMSEAYREMHKGTVVQQPTEQYICENADKCRDCMMHYTAHKHIEYCDEGCERTDGSGLNFKCIPLSEYEAKKKAERTEPKYKVGQKVVNKQRMDDRGYTYQRVQVVTWSDGRRLYLLSEIKGEIHPGQKYEENVLPYNPKQKPKKKRSTKLKRVKS